MEYKNLKIKVKSLYAYIFRQRITHYIIYNYRYFRNKIFRGQDTETFKEISVLSFEETIDRLLNSDTSLIRYGDGEFRLIYEKPICFQESDSKLALHLKSILETQSEGLMIAIPDIFHSLRWLDIRSASFWQHELEVNGEIYQKCLKKNFTYGNAHVFRPYIISSKNRRKDVDTLYQLIKKIWDGKDVVIIEGVDTKTGVGNDLFDGCRKIERILCPSADAFSKFSEILSIAEMVNRDKLILLSLGPTAKVLGFELYKRGFRVLDIGHIDSDYEWFCKGVKWKTRLDNGKHVAEGDDASINLNHISNENINKYYSEIISEIK